MQSLKPTVRTRAFTATKAAPRVSAQKPLVVTQVRRTGIWHEILPVEQEPTDRAIWTVAA